MNKLKPCPFCGAEADTTYNTQFNYQVFCTNDECFMNTVTMDGMATEEEAIEAWNRRVNEDAPTADVVERKKGRWIKMSDADGNYYACSECGEEIPRVPHFNPQFNVFPQLKSLEKTDFCPHCGADMRGNKNDEGNI